MAILRALRPILASLLLLVQCQLVVSSEPRGAKPARPNIIVIMTDDQDLLMDSLEYQPAVQKYFREQGTFFENHYCTIAQCCPSRVSLLTGKAAHNTNVTDVREPYGGYPKFVQQGLNGNWLPSWLQQSSYSTYYVGKLMNAHSTTTYNNPYPAGFNGTDFLIDPGTYIYYNATMQSNRDPPRNLPGQYSTDFIAKRATDFMKEATSSSKDPFFLTVAPVGPHGQTIFRPTGTPIFDPPVPAARHADLYRGAKVPRTNNFNPDVPSGASYIKRLAQWNQTVIDYYDEFYRLRLASLASIDDLIIQIFNQAQSLKILENTFIIYTSDNGFHIGQHRLPAGKSCAIEEDIRVPFFIRGPGVAKGKVVSVPTSHTDIAPTIFEMAGLAKRDDFDGVAMPFTSTPKASSSSSTGDSASEIQGKKQSRQEHVNVEFWGNQISEGQYNFELLPLGPNNTNTYKSLRLISQNPEKGFNLLYVVWCTNEHELYEMNSDPGQMKNLAISFASNSPSSSPSTTTAVAAAGPHIRRGGGGRGKEGWKIDYSDTASVRRLQNRLDTLLMVLKTCKAATCVRPWSVMHPQGDVDTLKDAMDEKYDAFYAGQPKIRFDGCALGYLRGLEGPGADKGDVKVWNGGK